MVCRILWLAFLMSGKETGLPIHFLYESATEFPQRKKKSNRVKICLRKVIERATFALGIGILGQWGTLGKEGMRSPLCAPHILFIICECSSAESEEHTAGRWGIQFYLFLTLLIIDFYLGCCQLTKERLYSPATFTVEMALWLSSG